jgi:transcriptional regulator with XRE-family HTH domain
MAKQRHFIREWRKFRDLNQEQLAERMGVGQPFISKIERGAQSPDLEFLERAADALNCSTTDLIKRDPNDPEAIWDLWEKMQPVQREQLVEIAKTLQKVS